MTDDTELPPTPPASTGAATDAMPAASRGRWASLLPQTPTQTVVAVLALMFLAGAVGFVVGTHVATSDDPSRESADVGFLYDMTAHHEQAVLMAAIQLRNGQDPAAMTFARDILRSQSYEIGLMESRLGSFGHDPADRPSSAMAWMGMGTTPEAMPGMASAEELDALREAEGPAADALFYALMIDHHIGGVAMAERAAEDADDDWVSQTASVMASIQRDEITEMAHARDHAGLTPNPPGYVSD